ncbi:NDR1/HIN1-like protein 13 [Bidens hawaiensis]|uniref:NDR1/HIN1-like protein 13 n=1 Tax=Bidens hawaiensis TaxID=980011 RepID=UPI00404B1C6D
MEALYFVRTQALAWPVNTIGPALNPTTTTTATKPQIYNAARPVYRPHPHRHRHSCYCYCYCCLWIIFIIMLLLIISAIATAIIYLLYRPHPPSFSVSNLQISQTNLTTRLNLTVVARNSNKKTTFYYDQVSALISSNGVGIGDGLIPAFVCGKKSTATLKTIVRGENVDLKEKKSLHVKFEMNAKVKVKIGGYESKKAHVRVVCDGVKAVDTSGELGAAMTKKSKCKVDLRIKIWKWTV